ncbi:hypothetical protein CDD81_4212 [Ophiocordyceps australis]|uniref:Uncharacterized protein n=1 Tax=Ophiocordyceps australis TaxID=1399860 RepID=A0A2C5YCJ9_9HYPO|nr:hypothetical protein CDD81_4212 [Ophiocordyceps australis]
MSLAAIEAELQTCEIVQQLKAARTETAGHEPSWSTQRLFGMLFPSSHAGINALLATAYISGPPNLLLALCPTKLDAGLLGTMVAFAVGGLLGDAFFHLLPEIFLGEGEDHGAARFVLVEPNRNLLLGLGVLFGFVIFVALDKGMRIATGGAHSHGHEGHGDDGSEDEAVAETTGAQTADGAMRLRKSKAKNTAVARVQEDKADKHDKTSLKLGGYLNLVADFTHNVTDGLAMAASFYASPTVGATTAVAVFMHEIPHEVGDFALLVQSGFSKRAAMASQFVTALGALLGTLIGIAVQELGGQGGRGGDDMARNEGIWGTSLSWGDMLLPFTAGTFIYVGTVAAIPELLENRPGQSKTEAIRGAAAQFAAMAMGAAIMLYISWHS